MLNENIKTYRKQKGYTQETLAQELNVVRQTVSKWEKGYSVPDAVMLERMAELFEVSVGDLLGDEMKNEVQQADLDKISAQLAVLNNQLARELGRKRKIRKFFKIFFIVIAFLIVLSIFAVSLFIVKTDSLVSEPVECEVEDKLDEAISDAILNKATGYLGECPTESHLIYGIEEDGDTVTVYLFEHYSSFGFENGFFIPKGGHSAPAVYRFKCTDDSIEFIDSQYPQDGSLYGKSIKKMFPFKYEKRALDGPTDNERDVMWLNTVVQAQRYLEKVGRTATVCEYGDIEHRLLEDCGVSVEVSNEMLDLKPDYDFWIGNHEVLEDGKRFVYQTDIDKENGYITYTKFEFETGKVVDFTAVSASDGKVVENAEKPEKAEYIMGNIISSSNNHEFTTVVSYIE